MTEPWNEARLQSETIRAKKEADRIQRRTGATAVVVVIMYAEGPQIMHAFEAITDNAPVKIEEVHQNMADAKNTVYVEEGYIQ